MNCKIVFVEKDERYSNSLRAAVEADPAFHTSWVNNTDQAMAMARRDEVSLIVIGPSFPADVALQFDKDIKVYAPVVSVVYIADKVTTELARGAMRSSIADILSAADQRPEDMAIAIRFACSEAAELREASLREVMQTTSVAKVVSVVSTKGGVGKTFVAANLAVALSEESAKKVIVLDLDLEAGDMGIMFNLKPTQTIVNAVQAGGRLDLGMLEGMLAKHSSGVRLLLSPTRPEDAELVSVAKVIQLVSMLREMCDVLVIDCPADLNEGVLAAVQASDAIVVVTAMEMTSVKSTRVALQKLRALGYSDQIMHLVINRSGSKVFLEPEDIEKALGIKAYAHIPSDRLVPRSVNMGVPVVSDSPKSAVSKSIHEFAHRLLTDLEIRKAGNE